MADHDIYAQQLYSVKYGLALYEPDPAEEYDHVRVGDVGFVQEGYFYRMFNVFHEADDSINSQGVPENFEPIEPKFRKVVKYSQIGPGEICSSSIVKAGASLSISG